MLLRLSRGGLSLRHGLLLGPAAFTGFRLLSLLRLLLGAPALFGFRSGPVPCLLLCQEACFVCRVRCLRLALPLLGLVGPDLRDSLGLYLRGFPFDLFARGVLFRAPVLGFWPRAFR